MDYHETFQTPLLPTKRNGPGKQRARVGVETYSVPSREGVAASHKVGRQESGAERTQKEHCPTLPMSLFLFGAPWWFTVHRACVQGLISLPAWRQEGMGEGRGLGLCQPQHPVCVGRCLSRPRLQRLRGRWGPWKTYVTYREALCSGRSQCSASSHSCGGAQT